MLFLNFSDSSTSYEICLQTFGDGWESKVAKKHITTVPNSDGFLLGMGGKRLPAISSLVARPLR